MGIESLSEDVLLVVLPEEPYLSYELETVNEIVRGRRDCDVIVDFSGVRILTSESVCSLMLLNRLLGGRTRVGTESRERQLILCNVPSAVKRVFRLTGLETLFTFADDKSAALTSLRDLSAAGRSTR
jgi:anti-anti-sigma regulatory factor